MRPSGPLLLVALLLAAAPVAAVETGQKPAPIPVLVDTDAGAYIDDAFALALVLTSPELELRGVTTVGGDAHTRALLVCRLLDVVGRGAVPVAAGAKRRDQPDYAGMHQYGLRPAHKRPVDEDAVAFLYQRLKERPGQVTLIALGPLTNVAALLKRHPDARQLVKRVVLMGGAVDVGYDGGPVKEPEWNFRHDAAAAQAVFNSGVPLTVAPLDATVTVKLDEARRKRIFSAPTTLARHLHALYELWAEESPVLYDAVAAALAIEDGFCKVESMRLEVDDRGFCRQVQGEANARVATAIQAEEFLAWLEERVTQPALRPVDLPKVLDIRLPPGEFAYVMGNRIPSKQLAAWLRGDAGGKTAVEKINIFDVNPRTILILRAAFEAGIGGTDVRMIEDPEEWGLWRARPVTRGGFPKRVHVAEDYETDIERRWWLAGQLETDDVPPGSTRACRGVLCSNFDRRRGDPYAMYKAVIFNPVPGPPMGPDTRLSFRCKLRGADWLRVQIYSLSKGFHRRMRLTGLSADGWQEFTVDMTRARRPDAKGGTLSAHERIDDIQFYTDPGAELLIDDVVLYDASEGDAAAEEETRPFPRRVLFTGWFDTGRQGREWPGRFEIVPHEKPRTWKKARSVPAEGGEVNEVRVGLRGARQWRGAAGLDFRYRLSGATRISVSLQREGKPVWRQELSDLVPGDWSAAALDVAPSAEESAADEIVFGVPKQAQLEVDDVLLYQPGKAEGER